MASAWGWFTGEAAAKKQANETAAANTGFINQGLEKQINYLGGAREASRGYYQPYAQSGQQGQQAYTNLLGLNGHGAQQAAMGGYQGWNPYLSDQMSMADKAIARNSAASGQYGSGLNALARQRSAMGMGSQDFYAYNQHLQGLGQQGMQAANAMSGNEWNYANGASGAQAGATQGLVGNNTQLGNALSAARISPLNYMMQNANMAISAMTGRPGSTSANNFGGR